MFMIVLSFDQEVVYFKESNKEDIETTAANWANFTDSTGNRKYRVFKADEVVPRIWRPED